MKFLADECCDLSMILYLREEGHQVDYIQENNPGVTDTEVLEKAYREKRVLITEDKDFGELIYRFRKPAFGIILLRFDPLDQNNKIQKMGYIASQLQSKLEGNFLVVNSEKIRIKPLHD